MAVPSSEHHCVSRKNNVKTAGATEVPADLDRGAGQVPAQLSAACSAPIGSRARTASEIGARECDDRRTGACSAVGGAAAPCRAKAAIRVGEAQAPAATCRTPATVARRVLHRASRPGSSSISLMPWCACRASLGIVETGRKNKNKVRQDRFSGKFHFTTCFVRVAVKTTPHKGGDPQPSPASSQPRWCCSSPQHPSS